MTYSDRYFEDIENKKWLGLRQACDYLGKSRHTLLRWRREFGLPCHVVGRSPYFLKRDLDQFVERHQVSLAIRRIARREGAARR